MNSVAIGDIASRVQCPEDVDPCNPDEAEDGPIYTCIYEVRPVERAPSFALAFPAHGFTGVAGYDAEEVLAEGFNTSISCADDRIIWSFPEESRWSTGKTVTLFLAIDVATQRAERRIPLRRRRNGGHQCRIDANGGRRDSRDLRNIPSRVIEIHGQSR